MVELNLLHLKTATPLGLISQAVLERTLASASLMKSSIASGS